MRIRAGRVGLGLLVAVLLTEGFNVAEAAVPYLQLVSVGAHPGQYVIAYGSGFCKEGCSSVTIKVDGRVTVKDVAVGGDGRFRATLSVTDVGEHRVSASQRNAAGQALAASASLNIPVGDEPSEPTVAGPPRPASTSVGPGGTPTSVGSGRVEASRPTASRRSAVTVGGRILGLVVLAAVALAVARWATRRRRSQAAK